MDEVEIVDLFGDTRPAHEEPDERLPRAQRKRTDYKARNDAVLAQGRHPATLHALLTDGTTCGDCAHLHRYRYHSRQYVKCDKHRLGESHSEASDVRVSWPACTLFEPVTEETP